MDDLIYIAKKINFWAYAKCTHSLKRFDPGVAKYRHKYDVLFGKDKFRKLRYYKDPTGKIKKTIEIEI